MKRWRVAVIFILVMLCGAAIIGRLVFIQIFQSKFYKALAQGQQNAFQSQKGERGRIFFKGGEILATNIKGRYVFAAPSNIKEASDKENTAKKLSEILGLKEEEVLEKLKRDTFFERIKINISEKEIEDLKNANLSEVYVSEEDEILRVYPQETMASQLTGFLGGEGVGQYGIEGFYEDILKGKESFESYYKENSGEKSINGSDVFLTIDYNIQFKAEELLKKAKENMDIEGGQIIVADPNTGEILAMANYPNFDINDYSNAEDFSIFQNGAIQKLYEPGSVFKPITMAGALEMEKITPQTSYYDSGKVQVGSWTIFNYGEKSYGENTMTQVLEKSINTGAVFAERQLGDDLFLSFVEKFGFFKATGIDLQNEIFSENKELKKGYEINYCTASFGQGIEVTPIQIVRAFSAVANGGRLVKPYVVEKIVNGDGVKKTEPEITERVISEKTASQLTAMMVSVTENGFAKTARVSGYYIAGKTGTSQVSWSSLGIDKKGYSDNTWQSFIGFAPAFKPKFLVMVKLDNPKIETATQSSAPVFREMAKYIIDYLEIPPDHEEE